MSAPLADDEIEITEAMLATGERIVADYSIDLADGFVTPAEVAEEVYRAMREVYSLNQSTN